MIQVTFFEKNTLHAEYFSKMFVPLQCNHSPKHFSAMEDLFKKLLYAGVGLVAVGAEKVQKTVDQLISEDKLTVEEGKKIVDEFVSNTESKKEEFESQLRLITEKVVKGFSFATTKDLEALAARVEALENKSKPKKEVTA